MFEMLLTIRLDTIASGGAGGMVKWLGTEESGGWIRQR